MKYLNILGKHIREATTDTGDESRRLAMTGQCTLEPQDLGGAAPCQPAEFTSSYISPVNFSEPSYLTLNVMLSKKQLTIERLSDLNWKQKVGPISVSSSR